MTIKINTPFQTGQNIAKQARARRLSLNLSQKTLSERAGVSYSTLKKFEQTGKISLESLLKIALVLDELDYFDTLFANKPDKLPNSLDELLAQNTRMRGRK